MAMLTIKARRFIKRTCRKLDVNGQIVGFDRSKVECYNLETPTESALVSQDGIGGYDWSYQAKEEDPTNFALMAHTSLGSLSNSDSEVDSCSKSCVKAYATLKEQYDSLSSDYKKSQFNLISYKAVESENMDVITVVTPSNVKTVESNHESAGVKSNGHAVEPKTVRKNSFRPPVIEDWNSDDDSEGNPQQKEYKEKRVIYSGCSRHMTGNKCYLTEYEDYDGGFVSFGDGKGRISGKGLTCLFAKATIDESNLWHKRLGHINFKNINKLVKGNLVRGLPSKIFENDHSCVACQKGESNTKPCKAKLVNSISKPLLMLHMDLFSPTNVKSLMKKTYCLVVTDDFSRFSWFCEIMGIKREFSVAKTPQQNGVAERRNRTLIEAARTMKQKLMVLLKEHRDNIVLDQSPKDCEEDYGKKPAEMDESEALDKDGEDDQATRSEFERLLQQEKAKYTFLTALIVIIMLVHLLVLLDNLSLDDDLYPTKGGMDVKSCFLYGTIKEEVYVCQPPGFEDPQFPDKVYNVEKALYGLHQAPKAWYETLSTYLIKNGFSRGTIDKTLFIKKDKGLMHKRFQMSSMGELTFFLGLQVQQKKDGIFISQDKYVVEILKKFNFATVKTASTPMEPNKALVKDEEADSVDVHLYRSMIGSLMYLTASRPDVMYAVCLVARVPVTPKMSHLHAVKRIFRYLKGQPKLGLWYPRDSPFDLEAFFDSDYAGASLDRKSTTRGYEFLSRRLISWQIDGNLYLIEKRVLALKEEKTAQDRVITKLKLRVKRLEKKKKVRTPQPMKRRQFKGRVETSTDKSLVIVEDKGSGEKGGSTTDQVSTARPEVSAASVPMNVSAATPSTPPTTTTIFSDEDLTIAQTLVKIRSEKAKEKEKGVVLIDEEEPPRLNRSTTTLQPLLTIDLKDKGKGVLVKDEPEKPVKVKRRDQGLTHEEQEKYTIEERARLLAEFFERKETIGSRKSRGNKEQTTYKNSSQEQDDYLPQTYGEKKWINDFKPIDDDSQQQAKSTKKRPRADSEEESSKKQKLEGDNDAEKEELRDCMDVVPRDDVAIDVESLATKYPIVDWKTHILNENMMYYQIIKADGSSKNYKIFSEMLDDFDRQDVMDLHRLVQERYDTTSLEGYDLLLWGDLKTLFELNKEDEI
ncbi:putative ribonuclease H-like domain-containing protein [Tanacetum coccineum]